MRSDQRPAHVPKFGNWDVNDQVPYTAAFESARVGKVGKMINPNDPAENPAAFGGGVVNDDQPPSPPYVQTTDNPNEWKDAGPPRMHHHKRPSREEGDYLRPMESSARTRHAQTSYRGTDRLQAEARYSNRYSSSGVPLKPFADGLRRSQRAGSMRENGGPEENYGADHYQGRLGNRPGSTSPGRESKTVGMRPKADDIADRGAVLPKFGVWNDNNPASGEGFTVIFNQARNEKKTGGSVRIPALQQDSPARLDYADGHKQPSLTAQHKQPSIWTCCFSSSSMKRCR